MRFSLIATIFVFIFSFGISSAFAEKAIGHVDELKGKAFKMSLGGKKEALSIGDNIYLHDHIETDLSSGLKVLFVDRTEITLGEEASLTIDEYIYEEDPFLSKQNKARFSLPQSAFHYVSGLISKTREPDVQLDLDFGSIGIRGTQIWRDMVADETGRMMCRIYVEDGSAFITNHAGQVRLDDGQGTKIYSLDESPETAKVWGDANVKDIKSKSQL